MIPFELPAGDPHAAFLIGVVLIVGSAVLVTAAISYTTLQTLNASNYQPSSSAD